MEFSGLLKYKFPLDRGEDVRQVQLALTRLKIEPPCGDADGIFGEQTRLAVLRFQKGYNVGRGSKPALDEDGEVGKNTWPALMTLADAAGTANTAAAASNPGFASLSGDRRARVPNDERAQTLLAKAWLTQNFSAQITQSVAGTPFDVNLVCAIAARETAVKWLAWVDALSPDELLARCVFDASGDYPGTSRGAFPVNAAAFRDRFGDAITQALIDEANKTRALQGWGPETWLYKGYGIYQYDLQHFPTDEAWFRDRKWGTMDGCLSRLLQELKVKHAAANGDLRDTIRRYNGSGAAAEEYAANVMQRYRWCQS